MREHMWRRGCLLLGFTVATVWFVFLFAKENVELNDSGITYS